MFTIERVEQELASSVNRKHGVLVGSGTTAIMLACLLLNQSKSKVIIPANVCLHVLYGVLYAGKQPVFVDVNIATATIDLEQLSSILRSDPDIGAVVAVHLYGHSAEIESIRLLTKLAKVILIEDVAQAQGGSTLDGKKFGTFGDLAIFSFGHTKILDVGGGGALLFDNEESEIRLRLEASKLAGKGSQHHEKSSAYSKTYYELCGTLENDRAHGQEFYELSKIFKELFVYSICPITALKLQQALPTLDTEIANRRDLYGKYMDAFHGVEEVGMFEVSPIHISPWRFTLRVPSAKRDQIISKIRDRGLNASAWYPSIPKLINHSNFLIFRISNKLEKEIINLWVTKDQNPEKMKVIINIVIEELRK